MENFEIKPFIGAGPVRLGMDAQAVRQALASEGEPSAKYGDDVQADFFPELGIFAAYKSSGGCETLEFSGPAAPVFEGKQIIGRPFAQIQQWLAALDPGLVEEDAGFHSEKLGFSIFAPGSWKDASLPVKGVLVFDRDYYGNAAS